ncbi:transporter substrate-binding domain-containing protein [Pelomonas sp. SE-A7]|uniref:substrate-binding periplasmic protein n=1 Tax=Pelomonas sp. SE-A7 TaxID=3054953 RepID=UPI00259C96CB|nr:transporter substrate-binding domain-containing protein [Pelomonas sp. SE-A7]MDM4766050.1 transporter substrate-binding domain-containing protein [Pelomonas sp. SE-A7]
MQCLAAAWLVLSGAAAAADLPIFVPAQEKAPHKFILGQGAPRGICPDLLLAMQKLEPGLRFEGFDQELSLSLIEQGLRNGNVGAACALLDLPSRQAYAHKLATPLYRVRHMVVLRADDAARPTTLQDLRKLSGEQPMLTTRGASHGQFLLRQGFRIDESTGDYQANLRKLLAQRSRFFYGGEFALLRAIQASGLEQQVKLLPSVFHEEMIYFWTSRKLPLAQHERLERALSRLQASGELARIVRSYHEQP